MCRACVFIWVGVEDHTHVNDTAGLIMQKKSRETFYKHYERPRGEHTHTHAVPLVHVSLYVNASVLTLPPLHQTCSAAALPVCKPAQVFNPLLIGRDGGNKGLLYSPVFVSLLD